MLISNLIALEDIIQNEEKEIFYIPKEKYSLHNFLLIFLKPILLKNLIIVMNVLIKNMIY